MKKTSNARNESQAIMARSADFLPRLGIAMLLLSSALALSSCGNLNKDGMSTGAIPDDYRTRHPIMINEVEHTLDVPIASGDRSLTIGLQDSISGFAQEYRNSSSGVIQIMAPEGSPNSGAAAHARKQIRQLLVARGIPSNRIIETSYHAQANGDAAPIRLSYVATTAVTNQCGEWPEDLQNNTFSNRNYHNFGCATQSNLAAQIANPMDLVTPRAQAPIDAGRRSTVIGQYRTGSDPSSD